MNGVSTRGVLGLAAIALAIGFWSGCPDDGGGGGDGGDDGGQDGGQDSGSGGDAGQDGGGGDAGSDAGSDAGGGTDPSISASNQTLTLSTEVTIASVTANAAGWVVVSAPLSDGGAATGATGVTAGTSSGVRVAVGDPLADGTSVATALYADLGTPGAYEPGVDTLVRTDGGQPVAGSFQVTVPAGTPAVSYTVTPQCAPCVWVVSATPTRFFTTLSTTGPNPTVTLYSGWRYQVVNSFFQFHPFELINTTAADLVLLSETSAGTFESDPSVAWTEGNGTSRFTLSPSLEASLSAYRCSIHTSTMRGPFSIQAR